MTAVADAKVLYGPDGAPIRVAARELAEEDAAPISGRREATFEPVVSNLTPSKLSGILKDAVSGDPQTYFAMAEEIEERDLHYGSVLGTRKRAVGQLDIHVTAVDDEDAAEVAIAGEVRALVEQPSFIDMLDDALDALGKGVSAVEQMWDTTGKLWMPREWIWRDPRFFDFDETTKRELRLRDGSDREPLKPGKWVTHLAKVKSGLPIRAGLARMAAWAFVFKSYTLKDWAGFCEIFGIPFRIGRYDRSASEKEKRALLRAVLSLASDGGAIVPKGMELELVQAGQGRGEAVFGAFADYLDKQVSKGVLGQTMTSDDGASLAQAKVHDEVRDDIRRADARRLSSTIQRDVIEPFVQMNFGLRERYPQFRLHTPEAEDLKALSEALGRLVPVGLRVSQDEVRTRLGFREPDEGEDVLGSGGPAGGTDRAANRTRRHVTGCACARCSDEDAGEREMEAIGAEELAAWEEVMEPVVEPILAHARNAGSYEDFLAGLEEAAAGGDVGAFMRSLAAATTKAEVFGESEGGPLPEGL